MTKVIKIRDPYPYIQVSSFDSFPGVGFAPLAPNNTDFESLIRSSIFLKVLQTFLHLHLHDVDNPVAAAGSRTPVAISRRTMTRTKEERKKETKQRLSKKQRKVRLLDHWKDQ